MKPTAEQIVAFATTDLEEVKPPGPYEIALTLGAALLASGRYGDDPSAAVSMAWTLVLPFYAGKAEYEAHGRAMFELTQYTSPAEGEMSAAESRAYVTGGETGDIGELGLGMPATVQVRAGSPASEQIDLAAAEANRLAIAKQVHIAACAERVKKAGAERDAAAASKNKARIRAAAIEWEAATAEQSQAYL